MRVFKKNFFPFLTLALATTVFLGSCGSPLLPLSLPGSGSDLSESDASVSRGVPFPDAKIFLGDGYNVLSHSVIGNALTSFDAILTKSNPGSTAEYKTTSNYNEMQIYLKFGADSGFTGPFGAQGSMNGSISNTLNLKTSSIVVVMKLRFNYGEVYVDNPVIKDSALALYTSNPDLFRQSYGDGYRTGATLGGQMNLYFHVSNIDFSNTTIGELTNSIKAGMDGLSARASATYSASLTAITRNATVSLTAESIGSFLVPSINVNDPASILGAWDQFNAYYSTAYSSNDLGKLGVLAFRYNQYQDLVNANLQANYDKYNAWKDLENRIRYVKNDTTDPTLLALCDEALNNCVAQETKCVNGSTDATAPASGLYDNIFQAWNTSVTRNLYSLFAGYSGVLLNSSADSLVADVNSLKTATGNSNFKLFKKYNFPVFGLSLPGSLAVYQALAPASGSAFLTTNVDLYNQKLINEGYTPFLGKRIAAYLRPADAASYPELAALLPTLDQGFFAPNKATIQGMIKTDADGTLLANGLYRQFHADVNNDGYKDLIQFSTGSAGMWIAYGNAAGSYNLWDRYTPNLGEYNGAYRQLFADVNGDQRDDLVQFSKTNTGMWISLAKSDGTFNIWDKYTPNLGEYNGAYKQYLADVNGDQRADLIQFSSGSAGMWISLAKSDVTFNIWDKYTPNVGEYNGTYKQYFGDVNGDGFWDLVQFANTYDTVWMSFGNIGSTLRIWDF